MEQEPVYVASAKLATVCESVLGKIYDWRQATGEEYIKERTDAYNRQVAQRNAKRRWLRVFGVKPEMYITPVGMELTIKAEVAAMEPAQAAQHPMIQIYQTYGQLEHEAKDALIMAKYSDSVAISADFARGISHLGVDPGFLRRDPFGFIPSKP